MICFWCCFHSKTHFFQLFFARSLCLAIQHLGMSEPLILLKKRGLWQFQSNWFSRFSELFLVWTLDLQGLFGSKAVARFSMHFYFQSFKICYANLFQLKSQLAVFFLKSITYDSISLNSMLMYLVPQHPRFVFKQHTIEIRGWFHVATCEALLNEFVGFCLDFVSILWILWFPVFSCIYTVCLKLSTSSMMCVPCPASMKGTDPLYI